MNTLTTRRQNIPHCCDYGYATCANHRLWWSLRLACGHVYPQCCVGQSHPWSHPQGVSGSTLVLKPFHIPRPIADVDQVWTLWAAGFLFLAFGVRMLQEGLRMQGGNSHIQEEMREVEEELEEDSSTHDPQNARGRSIPLEALEEGKNDIESSRIPPSPSRFSSLSDPRARSSSPRARGHGPSISFPLSKGRKEKVHWAIQVKETVRRGIQILTSPVFAQAFILTFLGEWGDRSQITTIAMAGANVSTSALRSARAGLRPSELMNRACR